MYFQSELRRHRASELEPIARLELSAWLALAYRLVNRVETFAGLGATLTPAGARVGRRDPEPGALAGVCQGNPAGAAWLYCVN